MSTNPRNRQQLLHDLSQLIPPTREPPTLRREDPLPPIPARRGYIERNAQPGRSAGGGIASPLIEGSETLPAEIERTYHPVETVTSTDGIFVWELRPVASVTMIDANGQEVVLQFAPPSYSSP